MLNLKFFKINSNLNVFSLIRMLFKSFLLEIYVFIYFFIKHLRLILILFIIKLSFFLISKFVLNVFFYLLNFIFQSFFSKFYFKHVLFYHLFFITNLDLYLVLGFLAVFFFFFLIIHILTLIPKSNQAKFEFLYNFLAQMGFSHNGWKGQRYFIFLMTLFLFILVFNFLGMIPYSFTITSHIFQTFALGCGVILSITILGISRRGLKWFLLFFPNLPIFILPLFTCIEIVSYISRAFSLAIRLFANLMSGHTLLNILTGFILKIGSGGLLSFFIALIPFFLISAIILLEMIIAILQAYVFVTLVTIYLKDAFLVSH